MTFQPGTTLGHRLPAGLKLALVFVLSLGIALRPAVFCVTLLALSLLITSLCFTPLQVAISCWKVGIFMAGPMALLLVIAPTMTGLPLDPAALTAVLTNAARSGLSLLTPMVAALLVSATTSSTEILRTLQRVSTPIFGDRIAWRTAFAILLSFRTISIARESYDQVLDAFRARGIPPRPWNTFVPFLSALVGHALATGVALDARRVLE